MDPGDCKAVRQDAVTGVQLPHMDEDEPAWLSFVIARYLDEEWVEQPVHKEIGEAVAKLYRESRAEGWQQRPVNQSSRTSMFMGCGLDPPNLYHIIITLINSCIIFLSLSLSICWLKFLTILTIVCFMMFHAPALRWNETDS